MPLPLKTKDQFLSDILTSWAGFLGFKPNLPKGNPLLAMFESIVLAGLLFIQSQAVAIYKMTRAKTSVGADLDSFNADFNFSRKPAVKANGTVSLSVRTVITSNIIIPPGAIIQTKDGKIQYQIIGDINKPGWSVAQNAYILEAGRLSVDARVEALVEGSASNVQVDALNTIASAITGIAFVTNNANIANGADAESDDKFRERFKLFFSAINKNCSPAGTYSAAIKTPGVVAVSLVENEDRYGNPRPGYGLVIIDDGTGAPTMDLINQVSKAVANVDAQSRGFTINNLVIGPVLEEVTIALNVKLSPLVASVPVTMRAVEDAVINYVNSLEIGETLYLYNLSWIAQNADPFVIAIQDGSVKINDEQSTFVATSQTVIRTNNILTNIGQWF